MCCPGFVVFHDDPAADVWAAPVYLVAIVAFVLADISRPIRLLASRPLVYAGKVSFCFYLVHQVVIRQVVQLHLNAVVTMGTSLALSCVLAMALHHGIEHPAHEWIVTRFDARKKTTPSNPSAE
jgi:peptidoglycan/LPS O-acetylase OafA/YrhL